ncbi:MAG: 50S ribosomal protein L30 [Betaproteobacteria bacterium RBG_16_64_9]|nr:MAG: 50S ribosomal protein L30 [Betaproteobacteria bacterium RBG_16_64_9]OGA23864.1 MAG: 50S ribosomal protein L30 [Betaproteobacteria bacterium RIFCSPLOWO2_02_FULL_65_24]OGA33485.1 MAG: 50S ribosomal protein L30 [Betaproteobacteria bacterium RIFCSPLOWO2_12_FULL_62_13b]
MADATIKVKLVKSVIGRKPEHRATVRGLGLKRINQVVEVRDTPEARGMIHCVRHLVRVEG